MNDSYTVIKRFTPPTCTLEICQKNTSFSKLIKQRDLKNICFKLSFDDPRNLDSEPIVIRGDRDNLDRLYNVVLSYTETFLEKSFVRQSFSLVSSNHEEVKTNVFPYLTSQGLVKQELSLDASSPENLQQIVSLSATQLFDLVDALEEYKQEMVVLAELKTQQQKKSQKLMTRAFGGASILFALGLIAVGIKFTNSNKKPEPAITNTEDNFAIAPTTPKQEVVAPNVPEVAAKPTPKSVENETLSSTETLPPPPAVDTPKPPPNIPDPALYPPVGNLTIPPLPEIQPENKQPVSINPNDLNNHHQVESKITINSETEPTLEPKLDSQTTDNKFLPEEEAKEDAVNKKEEPEELLVVEVDSEVAAKAEDSEKIELDNTVDENEIALNDLAEKPSSEELTTRVNELKSPIIELPQLQEINTYFQQKWQNPSGLKQTLEYRLTIDKEGAIRRIVPIGKAAEIYLDRTNIPLMGESFVSPLTDRDRVRIRLLLSPDGDVRTFLE